MSTDSESKSESHVDLSDRQPIPVYVLPCMDQNEQVSLIDLWRVVAKHKMLVLSSFVVTVMLASLYIFLAEPLYRAEANLLPPHQQDIQSLMIDYYNKGGVKIEHYTPALVYQSFLKNLKSKGLRREYFDTYGLEAHYLGDKGNNDFIINRVFDKKFNGNLRVKSDKDDASFVTVSFSDQDPELAAQWLNQFIVFINKRTIRQLVDDVKAAIRAEMEHTSRQLESKLKFAAKRRQDKIYDLREALRIAKALGIEGASIFPVSAKKEKVGVEVNINESPLYMRGTKALEAEISVLESRKSDAPFVTGLRDLQEKLDFLEGLTVDSDNLSAVMIDAAADTPYYPVKPRKNLILILSAIFGLLAGVLMVYITENRSKVSV